MSAKKLFVFRCFWVWAIGLSLMVLSSLAFAKKKQPVSVHLEKTKLDVFYEEIRYLAHLRPIREVKVFSYIDGNVEKIFRENGELVKKGQSILAVKNITPGYSFSNHIVKAPLTGLITGFYKEVGSFIRKGPALLKIADTTKWRVSVPIPQKELKILKLSSLSVSQKKNPQKRDLRVVAVSKGEKTEISGNLLRISPNIDPVLGTTIVDFVFEKKDFIDSLPGEVVELKLRYSHQESVSVAEKYLQESKSSQGKYVYIATEDPNSEFMLAHKRNLKIGIRRNGFAQVLEGLALGEVIITKMPSWSLRSGQKVDPTNRLEVMEDIKSKKSQIKTERFLRPLPSLNVPKIYAKTNQEKIN